VTVWVLYGSWRDRNKCMSLFSMVHRGTGTSDCVGSLWFIEGQGQVSVCVFYGS